MLAKEFLKKNGYPTSPSWTMLNAHTEHRPDIRHRNLISSGNFGYNAGIVCYQCNPDNKDRRRELGSSSGNGKSLSDYLAKELKVKLREQCSIEGLTEVTFNIDA